LFAAVGWIFLVAVCCLSICFRSGKKSFTKFVFVFETSMYKSTASLFSSYFHCFSCSYKQTDPQSLKQGRKQASKQAHEKEGQRGQEGNARMHERTAKALYDLVGKVSVSPSVRQSVWAAESEKKRTQLLWSCFSTSKTKKKKGKKEEG
jgi:hypothetical protein